MKSPSASVFFSSFRFNLLMACIKASSSCVFGVDAIGIMEQAWWLEVRCKKWHWKKLLLSKPVPHNLNSPHNNAPNLKEDRKQ